MKLNNATMFKKVILLIMHTHLSKCKEESDPMFQEALDLLMKDIDWFFKVNKFNESQAKCLMKMDREDELLKKVFNGKEFHFVAFVLSMFDRFLSNNLNEPIQVFKRKTISRVKLYKMRIAQVEKELDDETLAQWHKDKEEAEKIAKKVWEKVKEYVNENC